MGFACGFAGRRVGFSTSPEDHDGSSRGSRTYRRNPFSLQIRAQDPFSGGRNHSDSRTVFLAHLLPNLFARVCGSFHRTQGPQERLARSHVEAAVRPLSRATTGCAPQGLGTLRIFPFRWVRPEHSLSARCSAKRGAILRRRPDDSFQCPADPSTGQARVGTSTDPIALGSKGTYPFEWFALSARGLGNGREPEFLSIESSLVWKLTGACFWVQSLNRAETVAGPIPRNKRVTSILLRPSSAVAQSPGASAPMGRGKESPSLR